MIFTVAPNNELMFCACCDITLICCIRLLYCACNWAWCREAAALSAVTRSGPGIVRARRLKVIGSNAGLIAAAGVATVDSSALLAIGGSRDQASSSFANSAGSRNSDLVQGSAPCWLKHSVAKSANKSTLMEPIIAPNRSLQTAAVHPD